MAIRVKEGERVLDAWSVDLCEDSGEWAVTHYIGGEDCELFDGFYPSRGVAELRAKALNLEAEVYVYYRDWEGDEI